MRMRAWTGGWQLADHSGPPTRVVRIWWAVAVQVHVRVCVYAYVDLGGWLGRGRTQDIC